MSTAKPAVEGTEFIALERKRFFDDTGYVKPVEAFSILIGKEILARQQAEG